MPSIFKNEEVLRKDLAEKLIATFFSADSPDYGALGFKQAFLDILKEFGAHHELTPGNNLFASGLKQQFDKEFEKVYQNYQITQHIKQELIVIQNMEINNFTDALTKFFASIKGFFMQICNYFENEDAKVTLKKIADIVEPKDMVDIIDAQATAIIEKGRAAMVEVGSKAKKFATNLFTKQDKTKEIPSNSTNNNMGADRNRASRSSRKF